MYGNGQRGVWAVVTGGSDGIGLAMCHELAAQGFNICIVSRNKEKIETKLLEIRE
jgi:short-subunit dehydrogenase